MFFPYGDTPNPQNYKPWMTRALIFINFAIFFLVSSPMARDMNIAGDPAWSGFYDFLVTRFHGAIPKGVLESISRYDLFAFEHGYKPGAPSLADLLFSLFLHSGIWHLLGNMLFLWIYGDNVEHRLGRVGFLAAYLLSGIVATLAYGAVANESLAPLIGASGAISGILGIYFILFGKNRVKIFVFLFPFIVTTWYIPARIFLGLYLVGDNLLPYLLGSDTGVAYGAHIGGFGAGLLIGLAVWKVNLKALWLKVFPGRRTVIREMPKATRPDPRSIIVDAEYVDDDAN